MLYRSWLRMFAILVGLGALASQTLGDEFVQFRGAQVGVVAQQSIPLKWSGTENVAWKVEIPGAGWSQPILWQDHLYVTTAVSDPPLRPKNFSDGVKTPQSMGLGGLTPAPKVNIDWQVCCLDASTGQTVWSTSISTGKPKYATHPSNTYATETPVADAEGVYVFFGATGTLAALGHDGRERWRQELGAFPSNNGFGTGSSLAIHEGSVFVQHFTSETATVAAFDTHSGASRWKHERKKKGSSWSSPIVWRNQQRSELIASGTDEVESLDLETGSVIWKLGKVKAPTACSVAADKERLYFGGSDPFAKGTLFALSAGSSGDLTPEKFNGTFAGCAWSEAKAAPGMASPVSNGEYLYVADNNILRCYDAKNGQRHYQHRLPDMRLVAASPLIIGDKLLVLDESGTAALVQLGQEFALVGGGQIEDVFWSTPAVGNQSIFMRGINALYCIRSTAP